MMRERFEQLAPRERLLVSVCAALVLFTLVWTFVVQPVIAARAGLLERVDSKQIQLVSFQSLAANAVSRSAGHSGMLPAWLRRIFCLGTAAFCSR